MEKFAVDLTWVRPGKVGGTESFIRNLLYGFTKLRERDFQAVLLVARDNYKSFWHYRKYAVFKMIVCPVDSANLWKRVLWQNVKMQKIIRMLGISRCLEPVYGKPFLNDCGIRYFTVIHDLQAFHYPEYWSRLRVIWMKMSWRNAVTSSAQLAAISEFVKDDIVQHYHCSLNKIHVIYNPVRISSSICPEQELSAKFGIRRGEYYYTVSSMLPHKNLMTAVKVILELKNRKSAVFYPLVISGVGGKERKTLKAFIEDNGLDADIIFTDFVSSGERNGLYRYCRIFLFPSIFEGFGMPPVEAMAYGAPVLTTKKTSIPEITGGLCSYVCDPYSVDEWADRIEKGLGRPEKEKVEELLDRYSVETAAAQYADIIFGGGSETKKDLRGKIMILAENQ